MSNNSPFYQAIMSGGNNWLNFSYRASRFEYWAWGVFMGLLDAIINIFSSGIDILLLIGFLIVSISLNVISEKPLINIRQTEQNLSVDN